MAVVLSYAGTTAAVGEPQMALFVVVVIALLVNVVLWPVLYRRYRRKSYQRWLREEYQQQQRYRRAHATRVSRPLN